MENTNITEQTSHLNPPPNEKLDSLAQKVGELLHHWGFKRIHGKIWTELFVADQPLDAADLVKKLKISKALVSISLRELLQFEIIQESGRSERGTHLYVANSNLMRVVFNILKQRELSLLQEIHHASEDLLHSQGSELTELKVSPEKLQNFGKTIESTVRSIENIIRTGQWATPLKQSGFFSMNELNNFSGKSLATTSAPPVEKQDKGSETFPKLSPGLNNNVRAENF